MPHPTLSARHNDRRDDRGGIVLGWLTKLAVVLAIVGVAAFDAISVGTTAANLSDQGGYAARAASDSWLTSKNIQVAYDAALAAAIEQDPANAVDTTSFAVDADGTVHLRVSRTASTLVLFRFSKTRHWADVERAASGRSVS